MLSKKSKAIGFIIMSAFGFAMMAAFVRLAGDLPFTQKTFFRNLVAVAVAAVVLCREKVGFKWEKGNLPLLIASQIAVAALAVFVYYPKWKKEGWAFTFPGIVLVSAVVGSYAATGTASDIVVAVLTVIVGGVLFAPLVEWVMKLFHYKGNYHVIALIQVSIFTVCIIWSFIVMYVILPLFPVA